MAGGWRLSNEDDLRALRQARHDARTLRTEAAWNHFAAQVARCEQLGLLDDAVAFDVDLAAEERAARPSEVDAVADPGLDAGGDADGPPRYATAD
jgi:hypothetical protein